MPKYKIAYTEEEWYHVTIEADSHRHALDKFWSHDWDLESAVNFGTEIQQDLDIDELPE